MRISDWSSDVCSSDLGRRRPAPEPAAADAAAFAAGRIRGRFVLNAATTLRMHAQRGFTLLEVLVATALLAAGLALAFATVRAATATAPRDRKSVVAGKRGSGRVDLGGPCDH